MTEKPKITEIEAVIKLLALIAVSVLYLQPGEEQQYMIAGEVDNVLNKLGWKDGEPA